MGQNREPRKFQLEVEITEGTDDIWKSYTSQVDDGIITEERLHELVRFEIEDLLFTYGFDVKVQLKNQQLKLF